MRFKINNKQDGWKKKFAFMPFKIGEAGEDIIWLEWYWSRDEGFYKHVKVLEDKPFSDN